MVRATVPMMGVGKLNVRYPLVPHHNYVQAYYMGCIYVSFLFYNATSHIQRSSSCISSGMDDIYIHIYIYIYIYIHIYLVTNKYKVNDEEKAW